MNPAFNKCPRFHEILVQITFKGLNPFKPRFTFSPLYLFFSRPFQDLSSRRGKFVIFNNTSPSREGLIILFQEVELDSIIFFN